MVPKQRKSGQTGGANHGDNVIRYRLRSALQRDEASGGGSGGSGGGNKGGCMVIAVMLLGLGSVGIGSLAYLVTSFTS
jgi:hypothetical protein